MPLNPLQAESLFNADEEKKPDECGATKGEWNFNCWLHL